MTSDVITGCKREGCPIAAEGRCLDGFPEGVGCPSAITDGDPEVRDEAQSEERAKEGGGEVREEPLDPPIELGGDESLTITQAQPLADQYGAEVILVAGEFRSGKTTLVAELYGRFLDGSVAGWDFAGSDCLMALDGRYHSARYASGLPAPDTSRTEEEDMRLLDLRLRQGARLLPLLFSDVRGEFFEEVIQGRPVDEQVPLAAHATRCVLLIDGYKVARTRERAEVLTRARMLVGGLTEAGGLPPGRPLAIVLAKADYVDDTAWFDAQADTLREFALSRGCNPVDIYKITARNQTSPHKPEGLSTFLKWLARPEREDSPEQAPAEHPERSFWRTDI